MVQDGRTLTKNRPRWPRAGTKIRSRKSRPWGHPLQWSFAAGLSARCLVASSSAGRFPSSRRARRISVKQRFVLHLTHGPTQADSATTGETKGRFLSSRVVEYGAAGACDRGGRWEGDPGSPDRPARAAGRGPGPAAASPAAIAGSLDPRLSALARSRPIGVRVTACGSRNGPAGELDGDLTGDLTGELTGE